MSLVNTLLTTGQSVLLATGHGDWFVVKSGAVIGARFTATFDTQQVIDPDSDLGMDPRMQEVIRILPPVPGMQCGDVVSCNGKDYVLTKREDNAASVTVDFWVEQPKT